MQNRSGHWCLRQQLRLPTLAGILTGFVAHVRSLARFGIDEQPAFYLMIAFQTNRLICSRLGGGFLQRRPGIGPRLRRTQQTQRHVRRGQHLDGYHFAS